MTRRGTSSVLLSVFLILFIAAPAIAGPGFKVKLRSGATYLISQVDPNTFSVSKPDGTVVGSIHRSGRQFEAFDASGHSLGPAAHMNPEALTLIDAHLSGGTR